MILERLDAIPAELEPRTGWSVRPEGACRGEVCVALDTPFDVRQLADRLGMALVHDERHGVWALGPQAGGGGLARGQLPGIVLEGPHRRGFSLGGLRGTKGFHIAVACSGGGRF